MKKNDHSLALAHTWAKKAVFEIGTKEPLLVSAWARYIDAELKRLAQQTEGSLEHEETLDTIIKLLDKAKKIIEIAPPEKKDRFVNKYNSRREWEQWFADNVRELATMEGGKYGEVAAPFLEVIASWPTSFGPDAREGEK